PYDEEKVKEPSNASLDNRFLLYSTEFWMEHANLAGSEFTVMSRHAKFFALNSRSWNKWLRAHRLRSYTYPRIPAQFSIFHIAARWGIAPLMDYVLNRGY